MHVWREAVGGRFVIKVKEMRGWRSARIEVRHTGGVYKEIHRFSLADMDGAIGVMLDLPVEVLWRRAKFLYEIFRSQIDIQLLNGFGGCGYDKELIEFDCHKYVFLCVEMLVEHAGVVFGALFPQ